MRAFFLTLAALAGVLFACADTPPDTGNALGAGNQYIRIVSSNHNERAWRRDVVMVDGATGDIIGDNGTVGEKAATDAIDTAASNSYRIAVASQASMTNSMAYLYSHTNQMAQYCVMTALQIAPETVRSNLTGYVVQTTTVGNYDYQYVWYDRVMALKPVRYVEYSYYGGSESVKVEWQNWTTNGVPVTVDGKTWTGCHLCKVERPAFARNQVCLDLPNEKWGKNGMTWGDMALRMDGNDLYTGFVTNGITGDVIYFDNGFYTTTPEGATEQ